MNELPKLNCTVLLIKREYKDFEDIIQMDKCNSVVTLKRKYGITGKVFIGHNNTNQPTWYREIRKGLIDPPDLATQSTRAVLLMKRQKRIFAFIFGHGKHLLKTETFERGFGFKVVLNNCEVGKLKSIDSSTIDTVTVQSRLQTSKSSEINQFPIDDNRDLLKAVTAEARDSSRYGKVVAGRDSFHFYHDFSFEGLKQICDRLIEDYNSEIYKQHFDWIDSLSEVKDPSLLMVLNERVVEEFNSIGDGVNHDNIHLAPPEIVNLEDNLLFSYKLDGQNFNEITLRDYIINKKPRDQYTLRKLKSDKVIVYSTLQQTVIDRWCIFDCIVTELEFNEEYYILTLGQWFIVNKEYLDKINMYINNIEDSNLNLIEYDSQKFGSEGDYNIHAAQSNDRLLCMDKVNIEIDNGKFELCDLLSLDKHLIHVKPWSSSSTLSHLFSQGRISAETLVNFHDEVIPKIKAKINDKDPSFEDIFSIDDLNPREYTIVFAIIYEGDKGVQKRLPFFSKLNFVHNVKTLRRMQFKVQKKHITKV